MCTYFDLFRSTGLFATEKKVILIEDLPFLSDTGKSQEFREIIRDFLLSARHPLVFILSDTYMGNSAINMILTPDILSNRCVHSIRYGVHNKVIVNPFIV